MIELKNNSAGKSAKSLEYEVSPEWMRLRGRQREESGAAARIKAQHSNSDALLWYVATFMMGCLGSLFYITYEALK